MTNALTESNRVELQYRPEFVYLNAELPAMLPNSSTLGSLQSLYPPKRSVSQVSIAVFQTTLSLCSLSCYISLPNLLSLHITIFLVSSLRQSAALIATQTNKNAVTYLFIFILSLLNFKNQSCRTHRAKLRLETPNQPPLPSLKSTNHAEDEPSALLVWLQHHGDLLSAMYLKAVFRAGSYLLLSAMLSSSILVGSLQSLYPARLTSLQYSCASSHVPSKLCFSSCHISFPSFLSLHITTFLSLSR